jgi:hypothetical protein
MPTEPVMAQLGGVKFFWNDAATKVGEQVAVMLSIENAMNYVVTGRSQTVTYDPAYLTPVKVVKSGLLEDFEIEETHGTKETQGTGTEETGEWQVAITGAVGGGLPTLPAGGGKFLVFVFEALKEGVTTVGGASGTPRPTGDGSYATVSIAAGDVRYFLGDVDGDGRLTYEDYYDKEHHRTTSDKRKFKQLIAGRWWTSLELKAGDFNGDRKIDNADYQLLLGLLKEKGLLP